MTNEELAAAFEKYEDDFLEFADIPESERRHHRPDVAAMLLLAERFPDTKDIIGAAEHDIIYFSCDPPQDSDYENQWPLSEDDVLYLRRCGLFWDTETDSLASFV